MSWLTAPSLKKRTVHLSGEQNGPGSANPAAVRGIAVVQKSWMEQADTAIKKLAVHLSGEKNLTISVAIAWKTAPTVVPLPFLSQLVGWRVKPLMFDFVERG